MSSRKGTLRIWFSSIKCGTFVWNAARFWKSWRNIFLRTSSKLGIPHTSRSEVGWYLIMMTFLIKQQNDAHCTFLNSFEIKSTVISVWMLLLRCAVAVVFVVVLLLLLLLFLLCYSPFFSVFSSCCCLLHPILYFILLPVIYNSLFSGIAQGSILSSYLCSHFYTHMEIRYLKSYLKDDSSLLIRWVDDFLYMTPDQSKADTFLTTMNAGIPKYGCQISTKKTLVNYTTLSGIPVRHISQDEAFPWCGFLVNPKTLDVKVDYSRYQGL